MAVRKIIVRLTISLSVLILSGSARSNAGLTFLDVADTTTAIPGGTGNFTSFGIPGSTATSSRSMHREATASKAFTSGASPPAFSG